MEKRRVRTISWMSVGWGANAKIDFLLLCAWMSRNMDNYFLFSRFSFK